MAAQLIPSYALDWRKTFDMRPKPFVLFVSWGSGAALLMAAVGCGNAGYTTVTGVVTLDDAPLADANVVFHAPGRPMATARTDESGRFRVETGGARGMKPGEYTVTVAAYAPPKTEGAPKLPKLIIPEKYVRPEKSGLKAVIQNGSSTDLSFALTKS